MKLSVHLPLCFVLLSITQLASTIDPVQDRHTLNSLLANPLKALQHNHQVLSSLQPQMVKEKIDGQELEETFKAKTAAEIITAYDKIFQAAQKNNPIFLLGECVKENFGYCSLSRLYRPEYREALEENAVNALVEKASTKAVQYTSFACGGAFLEFVVAVKTLTRKPDASLAIHLIDRKHALYVGCKDLLGTREIRHNRTIDPQLVMPEFIQKAKTEGGVGVAKISDELLAKQLAVTAVVDEQPFKQFLGYLKHKFPLAHVTLYAHPSTDSYLSYLEKHQIPHPDVITAADIQDEMSLIANSGYNYAKLCVKTLEKNPDNINILLAKKNGTDRAELQKISLKPTVGQEAEEFEDIATKAKASIYVSSTDIPAKTVLAPDKLKARL